MTDLDVVRAGDRFLVWAPAQQKAIVRRATQPQACDCCPLHIAAGELFAGVGDALHLCMRCLDRARGITGALLELETASVEALLGSIDGAVAGLAREDLGVEELDAAVDVLRRVGALLRAGGLHDE